MLLNLREYHRPGDEALAGRRRERVRLDQVLALLARPHIRTVVLAGGDTLVASGDSTVEAVVDLQGLGLDGISSASGRLRIGAMTTRSALAREAAGRGVLEQIVAEGAARWGGSMQRNRATIGGAVAVAAPNDPLVIALLACDATITLLGENGERDLGLNDFLPKRHTLLGAPALITDITLPSVSAGQRTGAALTVVARTPADAPIVVAAATLTLAGTRCTAATLALGGVSSAPLRLADAEGRLIGQELSEQLIAVVTAEVSARVQPSGDFRGSAAYRQAMAGVLSERALAAAWDRAKGVQRCN